MSVVTKSRDYEIVYVKKRKKTRNKRKEPKVTGRRDTTITPDESESGEAVRIGYESTLQTLRGKLQETKTKHRRLVEELLASQEQYQEDEELPRLKHEVDQYADTLGSQSLEYAQELENIERRLKVRHAAQMEAQRLEYRANIEVLRESLQQELQDVKAGYEKGQWKLRRTKHSLVATSPKAQFWLPLEALKKAHKAQIEKMKEKHASVVEQLAMERAQLAQHMAGKTSAIQEVKRKPKAHYTEIVDTACVVCHRSQAAA
ncbi:hypothetical protein HPB51_007379 [Rhipicephalus microplus]|uniref:Uncharacterized protein n=1 Tax=Rhipicephalus microplus TaxID=6941 RepID=A0A9J6EZ56_RHIMP|nr:hypothetical protein HPB51_007379 [Rhipicephalus microplus]